MLRGGGHHGALQRYYRASIGPMNGLCNGYEDHIGFGDYLDNGCP